MRLVTTYFEPLLPFREADDRALLKIWEESWQKHGWATEVLTREDARRHSDYNQFVDEVSKFPTVNGKEYEVCCFVRHLAFQRAKSDLFSDFDFINYGWNPAPCDLRFHAQVHSFYGGSPSIFCASPSGFEWLMKWFRHSYANHFQEEVNGRPHISDMTVFKRLPISRSRDGREFADDGWRESPMVHYGNESFGPEKRWERILKARTV